LDEPSANLDETTHRWLSKRLKEYHGTVLLVSHDVDLLNLANETWLIKNKKLEVFPGNYAFTEDILNNRENK
jgi:ATPase subunit of ABC transporter with duplicated ATPase domains